jgi:hypothetical protein
VAVKSRAAKSAPRVIALAFASSKAKEVLGRIPEEIIIYTHYTSTDLPRSNSQKFKYFIKMRYFGKIM